ncbi:MAG: cytochrome C, partial [Bacteroidetes bacterium]|nr:cytochrome C [Bacteroidota bacterium]
MRKVILTVLAIIVLLIVGFASYIYFALPNVGKAPDLKISYTPEMVKHGEYLARHVSLCMD